MRTLKKVFEKYENNSEFQKAYKKEKKKVEKILDTEKKKKTSNDLIGWAKIIERSRLPDIGCHTNVDCIVCKKIKKNMVRVGAIYLCAKCFCETFHTQDPVKKERKVYLKLLRKFRKEQDG